VERQIEAVKVLSKVANDMKVNVNIGTLTRQNPTDYQSVSTRGAAGALALLASRLIQARNPADRVCATLQVTEQTVDESSDPDLWWNRLDQFIWAWDEVIQDELAAGEFGTASAYQLGRGLAETYWALNPRQPLPPADPKTWWEFLLGPNRVKAYAVLCQRLAPTIGKLTAFGVEASITKWGEIAQSPTTYKDPDIALVHQTLVWRDLLLTGRDPTTLVDPDDLAKASRRIWPLLRSYKLELGVGAAAAAILGLSIADFSHLYGPILSVLSGFGITTSAVAARTKTTVQAVGQKVNDVIDKEVVAQAVERLPERLPKDQWPPTTPPQSASALPSYEGN
jgi:hypothetical protein